MGMEDVLRIDKILDFCDVPQLFVARDAFDTLCRRKQSFAGRLRSKRAESRRCETGTRAIARVD